MRAFVGKFVQNSDLAVCRDHGIQLGMKAEKVDGRTVRFDYGARLSLAGAGIKNANVSVIYTADSEGRDAGGCCMRNDMYKESIIMHGGL